MERLPWIAAVLALSLLAVAVIVGVWILRRPKRLPPLPTEWSLSARPVFSTDERRVYYRLTPLGKRVLAAEMLRLRALVRVAEQRGIIARLRV